MSIGRIPAVLAALACAALAAPAMPQTVVSVPAVPLGGMGPAGLSAGGLSGLSPALPAGGLSPSLSLPAPARLSPLPSLVSPAPLRAEPPAVGRGKALGAGAQELPPYKGPTAKRAGTTLLNFPTYHQAPLSHPLETFGLYDCAALVVVDRLNGMHFMAHVTSPMPARVLEKVLREKGIAWEDAELYILPGTDAGTSRTIGHILEALESLAPGASGRVKYVRLPPQSEEGETLSIVAYGGRVGYARTGYRGSFKLGGKYFQGMGWQ